jgi:predicted phage terminase large subunit-like protein
VFIVVGIDKQENIYVLDVRRNRWNSLGLIDQLFEIQTQWEPELFGIETGQIELTLEPFIQKAEEERGIVLNYEKLKTRGMDKQARARPIQGRMEQGKVFFPTQASTPWCATFINEMLKFPLGKNDDCVDAIAWIGQMVMMFSTVRDKVVKKQSSIEDRLRKMGYGHYLNGTRHRSGMSA